MKASLLFILFILNVCVLSVSSQTNVDSPEAVMKNGQVDFVGTHIIDPDTKSLFFYADCKLQTNQITWVSVTVDGISYKMELESSTGSWKSPKFSLEEKCRPYFFLYELNNEKRMYPENGGYLKTDGECSDVESFKRATSGTTGDAYYQVNVTVTRLEYILEKNNFTAKSFSQAMGAVVGVDYTWINIRSSGAFKKALNWECTFYILPPAGYQADIDKANAATVTLTNLLSTGSGKSSVAASIGANSISAVSYSQTNAQVIKGVHTSTSTTTTTTGSGSGSSSSDSFLTLEPATFGYFAAAAVLLAFIIIAIVFAVRRHQNPEKENPTYIDMQVRDSKTQSQP